MSLMDLFRGARSGKVTEAQFEAGVQEAVARVMDGLQPTPPTAPPRVVMNPEQRRARGAERRNRLAAKQASLDVARAKADDADRDVVAAQARAQVAHTERQDAEIALSEEQRLVAFEIEEPLKDGRLPLVDDLIARLRSEAIITPDFYSRPTAVVRGQLIEEITITNEPSCSRRTRALIQLAERVESWTRTGAYATEEELRTMFAAAYRELPQIESLESHVLRVPGENGSRAAKFRRAQPEPFPTRPAA